MNIKDMRLGQNVRHPEYDGTGDITRIESGKVEVFFNHGKITLTDGEIEKLIPLDTVDTTLVDIAEIINRAVLSALTASMVDKSAPEMSKRFQGGTLSLCPSDPLLPRKDVPVDTFFHKIVMVRDNLRLLEQKINAHKGLSEQEKVEMQHYLTRMAGSLTTFNELFREKSSAF